MWLVVPAGPFQEVWWSRARPRRPCRLSPLSRLTGVPKVSVKREKPTLEKTSWAWGVIDQAGVRAMRWPASSEAA
jgi:hypothetical protein